MVDHTRLSAVITAGEPGVRVAAINSSGERVSAGKPRYSVREPLHLPVSEPYLRHPRAGDAVVALEQDAGARRIVPETNERIRCETKPPLQMLTRVSTH